MSNNSSSSSGGGGKKPPAPEFLLAKLKKGDIQGSYDPASVLKSEIKGNVQIHHKTISPLSPNGDFRISFDKAMMYSNLIYSEYAKDDGTIGVGLKTFLNLHGNYDIKDAHGNPTLSVEGHELKKDVENMETLYAESVDADPAIKRAVLAPLKYGPDLKARLEKPLCDGFMTSVIKRQTITDEKAEDYGEPDMSKGETMPFDLWTGTPKQQDKRNLMIGNTGQQLFTKIYDHRNGISDQPLSRWDQVKEFIYVKGESKATGRRTFRMKCISKALAPSMFANSETKKGRLQFKLAELHIIQMDYTSSTYTLPEQQKNSLMDEILRSRNSFVIQTEKPVDEPMYDPHDELTNNQQLQQNGGGNNNQQQQQQQGQGAGRGQGYENERRNSSPPRQQKNRGGNFITETRWQNNNNDDDDDEQPAQQSPPRQQQQQKQAAQPSGKRSRDNQEGGGGGGQQRHQSNRHHREEKKAKRPAKQQQQQGHVEYDDETGAYVRVDANGDQHQFDDDVQGGGASDDDS